MLGRSPSANLFSPVDVFQLQRQLFIAARYDVSFGPCSIILKTLNSMPVFLPTILVGMGYSSVNAQGLTAPPYLISFMVTILSTFLADKWQQRGYMIMFLTTMGGIGYILLAACNTVGVRYFGVYLAAAGMTAAKLVAGVD